MGGTGGDKIDDTNHNKAGIPFKMGTEDEELYQAIKSLSLVYATPHQEKVQTKSKKGKAEKGSKEPTAQGDKPPYNRWSLKDDDKIDYGFFQSTKGSGIETDEGKSFYLTTAINYTNGPPHMGHAYEAVTSDALARFARLGGQGPAYFVTGSDEHGQKIANTAESKGKRPIEICDQVNSLYPCDLLSNLTQ